MAILRTCTAVLFCSVISLAAIGCGSQGDQPPLGQVRGTVTMDEKPLAGVNVTFFPDSGRVAAATTDGQGRYELIFAPGVNGAKVGHHTVSIAWPEGEAKEPAILAKYNTKTELTADVKAGKNTLDFSLKSK